jgi:hypothetical protein
MAKLKSIGNTYDNIEIIKNNAFYGCKELELNSLPSNLKTIGEYAFHSCKKIHITELPEGL